MVKIMKLNVMLVILGITFHVSMTFGQSTQYQPDKPGKFILINQLNKCPGVDDSAIKQQLTSIVEWVRRNNPVINQPTGFDAAIKLSGNLCEKKVEEYGIQSSVYFTFRHYYIENGVSKATTDWAAHGAEIIINNPKYYVGIQFDETGFQTNDPAHLKQPLKNALDNLKKYYTTDPLITEIAPGVRLYAPDKGTWYVGKIIVFNPDLPDIWIPVTVKEIMEAKLAYYKIKQEIDSIGYEKTLAEWAKMNFKPAQSMRPMVYDIIKKEYENFASEELNKPAFASSSEEFGVSMINARGEGRPVARFNSACWDRSLPATAIQFLSIYYRSATPEELQAFKKRNDGLTDFVGLFFNSLPIEKMGELISLH
jgi:hypothetical protein